jgi:sterol desaturase/sphingolipid hydroxylase (fatty acid hydroxylase superfamily)
MALYLALVGGSAAWLHSGRLRESLEAAREAMGARLYAVAAGPVASLAIFFACWHGYGALLAWMDARPSGWWGRFKLHRRDSLGYSDMIGRALFNQLQLVIGVAALRWADRGLRVEPERLPSVGGLLLQIAATFLAHEVVFYTTHRALHSRALFRFHAKHHESKGSVGVSGMYQDSLDYLLTTTLAHMAAPVLFDTHCVTTWVVAAVGGLNSVHSHSGYEFPLGLLPSPREHDLHHANYAVNFGTGPLDYLLGTHKAPPLEAPPPRPAATPSGKYASAPFSSLCAR